MASTFTMPRYGCVSVRCSAEDGDDKKEQSTTTPPSTPVVTPPRPQPSPSPPPLPPAPPPSPAPPLPPTPPPTPPPTQVLSLASLIPLFKGVSACGVQVKRVDDIDMCII
ncbi:hypothetical protein Q3G72_008735 [Acer saccharum]|nr:hypothetical protein Q3G72_008735 [Acer saccharum]